MYIAKCLIWAISPLPWIPLTSAAASVPSWNGSSPKIVPFRPQFGIRMMSAWGAYSPVTPSQRASAASV